MVRVRRSDCARGEAAVDETRGPAMAGLLPFSAARRLAVGYRRRPWRRLLVRPGGGPLRPRFHRGRSPAGFRRPGAGARRLELEVGLAATAEGGPAPNLSAGLAAPAWERLAQSAYAWGRPPPRQPVAGMRQLKRHAFVYQSTLTTSTTPTSGAVVVTHGGHHDWSPPGAHTALPSGLIAMAMDEPAPGLVLFPLSCAACSAARLCGPRLRVAGRRRRLPCEDLPSGTATTSASHAEIRQQIPGWSACHVAGGRLWPVDQALQRVIACPGPVAGLGQRWRCLTGTPGLGRCWRVGAAALCRGTGRQAVLVNERNKVILAGIPPAS